MGDLEKNIGVSFKGQDCDSNLQLKDNTIRRQMSEIEGQVCEYSKVQNFYCNDWCSSCAYQWGDVKYGRASGHYDKYRES